MQTIVESKIILVAVAAGFTLLAAGIWLKRRSKTTSEFSRHEASSDEIPETCYDNLSNEPNINSEPLPEPGHEQVQAQDFNTVPFAAEHLDRIAEKFIEPDLRDFLRDIAARVRETRYDFSENTSFDFIAEIVDRLDDLKAIQKNHLGATATAESIRDVRDILTLILSACDVELVQSDQWDSSIQRAIAKEPTIGITAPTVLRYGSTGIRRQGSLIRKQEVVLAIPESR